MRGIRKQEDTCKFINGALPMNEAFTKYKQTEAFELAGMMNVHKFMYKNLCNRGITEEFINNLHYLLYGPVEETYRGIYAGVYRTYPSFTYRRDKTKKDYLDYNLIEDKMGDLVFNYNASYRDLFDICRFKLDFIHIHPYGDGNGRVVGYCWWAWLQTLPTYCNKWMKRSYIDSMDYCGCKIMQINLLIL